MNGSSSFLDSNQDLTLGIGLNIFDPFHALGAKPTSYVSYLQGMDDVVPIGCRTPQASRICSTEPHTIAYARTEDNRVVIFSIAFSNEGYHRIDEGEYTTELEWASNRVAKPSAGLYLLHEMTRLPGVLGGFQHWTSAPQDDSFDYFIAPSK